MTTINDELQTEIDMFLAKQRLELVPVLESAFAEYFGYYNRTTNDNYYDEFETLRQLVKDNFGMPLGWVILDFVDMDNFSLEETMITVAKKLEPRLMSLTMDNWDEDECQSINDAIGFFYENLPPISM